MKLHSALLVIGALAVASQGYAYTGSFTDNFDTAGAANWSDPANTDTVIITGETAAADSPAYAPLPSDIAAGFNGTGWLRLGTTNAGNFGVTLAIYDALTTVPPAELRDYTIEADVFVVVDQPTRHHLGLAGHWSPGNGNTVPEFFYSHNTPGQPNGFGWRSGGMATTFGAFSGLTLSSNQWVTMRMTFFDAGTRLEVGLDIDRDGTEEQTQEVTYTASALSNIEGAAGFFSVVNNPAAGSSAVTSLYSYFDNFSVTFPAPVQDWSMY